MQLGASQANQGTPPFWRGRLYNEDKKRFESEARCFLTTDVYIIEKDEAERK